MIVQYGAVTDKLTAILKDSGIQVISTVSTLRNGEGKFSWPDKGATSFLILYETAEDAVARGLWEGELPSHIVAGWVSDAEVLLSKHRERRRQFTLVSINAVLTEPESFRTELSRRFDQRGFPLDQLTPTRPAWSDWQGLLARQIVSSEPRVLCLSGELEAAALPFSARYYDPDAVASEVNVERKLLRDQIRHLQQAVEDGVGTSTDREREFSAMKLTLTAAQDRIDGLEAMLKGLTKQAAGYRADLDALTAGKQRLVTEFGQIMDRILNSKQLLRWPKKWRRAQQIKIIRDCGIVDPGWYLQHHEDVAKAGAEPFRHYIDYGAKEGRPPNEGFM